MNRTLATHITSQIAWIAIFWLIGAFIAWDFNAANWAIEQRFIMVVFWVLTAPMAVGAVCAIMDAIEQ